jgi:phosphatidylglycerophosphatase GEP4
MNLSGTLNVFRLIRDPALCLPQYTFPTFNHLPIPLSKAGTDQGGKQLDIRAVVLDKDNCFAAPHANSVYEAYNVGWSNPAVAPQVICPEILEADHWQDRFQELRKAYPGSKLLIVSNTAGTRSDPSYQQAELLERNTGVKVLHHSTKKPGCHSEILDYFRRQKDAEVTAPSQIAVVGDRLFTDVMTANLMGSQAFYLSEGVVGRRSVVSYLATPEAPFY